jgi:uncharacterized protein YwqG/predicted DNA-binding WGR domain protein
MNADISDADFKSAKNLDKTICFDKAINREKAKNLKMPVVNVEEKEKQTVMPIMNSQKKRFVFHEGKSQKFWFIQVKGKSLIVTFGALGSSGKTQTTSFETQDKCLKEANKLIFQKTGKGYRELAENEAIPAKIDPFALIVEKYKNETEKPCYKIEIVKNAELTPIDSFFGGKPYLPQGESYPVNKNGKSIPLFAQINFGEISLEGFPNKGIFQVFYDGDTNEHAVRYYSKISNSYQKDLELVKNSFVHKPRKIKFKKSTCCLPLYDSSGDGASKFLEIYNSVMATEEDDLPEKYDMYIKALKDFLPEANCGGYADSIQGEQFDYEKETVILKVDSHIDMHNICIGDNGILWVTIDNKDLRKGDFSRVRVGWDCH